MQLSDVHTTLHYTKPPRVESNETKRNETVIIPCDENSPLILELIINA